ncbi:MAG: hypothetical protein N2234_08200, partial [Planctomycetota bacterium]|nr:hypothetical protein [Planctomycetota bacterium]
AAYDNAIANYILNRMNYYENLDASLNLEKFKTKKEEMTINKQFENQREQFNVMRRQEVELKKLDRKAWKVAMAQQIKAALYNAQQIRKNIMFDENKMTEALASVATVSPRASYSAMQLTGAMREIVD